jgi:hypothetical protein
MRPTNVYLSGIYGGRGNVYWHCETKPGGEGRVKAISYWVKDGELRRENKIDVESGLGLYEAQTNPCYLEFNRCDEAVKVCKDQCQGRKQLIIVTRFL